MANMYMGDQALGTVAVVLNTADATATAADILKDKTAYVGNEKVVGTHECATVEELTSDADATAADIVNGKSAWVGGQRVVGTHECATVEELLPVLSNPATADIIPAGYESIDGLGNLMEGTGAGLGDAIASDVLSGKTFTSANGVNVVGTGKKGVMGTITVGTSATATLTIPELIGCTWFAMYGIPPIETGGSERLYLRGIFYFGELDHMIYIPYQRTIRTSRTTTSSNTVHVTFDSSTGTITVNDANNYVKFYNTTFYFVGA